VTGALLFSNDSLSLFFFFFSVKRPVAGKIISLNLFLFFQFRLVSWAELPRERRKTGKTKKLNFQ
jgi:hypothetical protein